MASTAIFQNLLNRITAPERDLFLWIKKLENRLGVTLALLFCLSFAGDLLFTAAKGWPIPSLHDEFSYLLAADTFEHGRFANPSHPFSPHFETFHVLQQPTYASKYPPLPGVFLAFGQLLGHPALGIFLGSSLTVAAIYWALRSLLSHSASFFAAMLAWAQLAPYSYYSSSYMGGSVSALGSCLLFGAAVRLVQLNPPLAKHAIIIATGVLILATSRPFEGMVVCSGIGLLLGIKFFTNSLLLKKAWLKRVVLPASLVLLAGGGFLLSYNKAVTGNALVLPYSAYEALHSRTPLFTFGTPRNVELPETPHLRQFEKEFTETAFQKEKAKSFADRFIERLAILLQSFIPFWYPVILLLLFSAWASDRWTWFSWAMVFLVLAACSFTVWFSRHYLGCFLPFLCLIACAGATQLCSFQWRQKPVGFHVFRIFVWSLVLFQTLLVLAAPSAEERAGDFARNRMSILKGLQSLPRQDLVLVSYGPHASVHEEWVYNRADMDRADVVWAHSLGKIEDENLMDYFSNRRVWRLQVDQGKPEPVEVLPSPPEKGRILKPTE